MSEIVLPEEGKSGEYGKYICYCPAFNIIWSKSSWVGKGECWAKMCLGSSAGTQWTTLLFFADLMDLTFPRDERN
jgi:hypothetical protein